MPDDKTKTTPQDASRINPKPFAADDLADKVREVLKPTAEQG
jgi:hypothetical protein